MFDHVSIHPSRVMTVEVYHDPSPDFASLGHYVFASSTITSFHSLAPPPFFFLFFLDRLLFSSSFFFSHSLILFPLLFSPLATRPISSHHGLGAYSHTSSHRPCLAPPPPPSEASYCGSSNSPARLLRQTKPSRPQQFPCRPSLLFFFFSSAVKSKERKKKNRSRDRPWRAQLARATEIWCCCAGFRSVGTWPPGLARSLGGDPSIDCHCFVIRRRLFHLHDTKRFETNHIKTRQDKIESHARALS